MNALEVGQQLRQAREAKALTLEQVAQITHMRLWYLQALEEGNYEALPSRAQARGFLRAYADYLNLPSEDFLVAINGQAGTSPTTPPAPPQLATAFSTRHQPEPVTSASFEQANHIFEEVGKRLQHQRELLGLSLDDVVRHTHLRRHYLQALESGTLDVLPSPVQGRGMLNNYAAFLGMDPEPLMLRFAEGLQARLAVKQAVVHQPVEDVSTATSKTKPKLRPRFSPKVNLPAPVRRLLSSDLLIGSILTLFLVGFVIWGAIRTFSIQSDQAASPTAPSIADVLLATSTPTQTPTLPPPTPTTPALVAVPPAVETALAAQMNATAMPEDGSPDEGEAAGVDQAAETGEEETPGEGDSTGETVSGETSPEGETSQEGDAAVEDGTPAPDSGNAVRVQVYITVRERTWMRALVDGKIELEGRVLPGSAYTFAGDEQVEILTGNGAALQIFYNDQDLGLMGVFGQVVNRIYTLQGVVTPTPTATMTPTATSRVSATPVAPAGTPAPGGAATAPALP